MDVQNNNITIQITAKNLQGKPLRVCDCDLFIIHVFTDDPSFYLTYSGRDMLATEFVDEITIPKRDMEQLRSGVVQYTYHYLPKTETNVPNYPDGELEEVKCPHHPHHHFHNHPHRHDDFNDDELINSKPVVTSIYWRNLKHNHHPHHPENGVNMNDLDRLHRLLDVEIFNRMKDVDNLNKRFDGEFTDKLNAEIERSTTEDERLLGLIESLQSKADEIIDNANDNNEEVDNKIAETVKNVEDETARAKKAEADLEVKIKQEETARIAGDEIIDAKLTMERERAQANEQNLMDRVASVTERFDSFKTIQSEALSSEIERSKSVESSLNEKINNVITDLSAEVSRAAQKDIEHQNLVETEANRAKAVENKIATDLETEVSRAKDSEKHILDEVHSIQDTVANLATATNVYTKAEVDTKINSVKNDIATIQNEIDNHNVSSTELSTKVSGLVADVDKAKSDLLVEIAKCDSENDKLATELKTLSDSTYTKAETDTFVNDLNSSITSLENWKNNHSDNTEELNAKVSQLTLDVDKAKSDLLAEIAKCDAENNKLATDIQTLSDSVYNKSEVDSKFNDVNSSIASLENWKDNHSDNTEVLNEKVAKLIADTEKLSTDLATETTNRTNSDLTLQTKVDVADGKIDAEVERAKASEKLISDSVAEIKETATSKHTELSDSIAEVNADLILEIARAKAAEKVNADAIEIINGDVETSGSIKKSLKDSKDYTDAEIAKLSLQKDSEIADTLKSYATKDDVDKKISDVIGTAPEALDTLGKISNALSQDSDAITAINEVLSGKANSSDVYTKTEIDTEVTSINNSISTLETKVDNSDATLNGRIDDLITKVNGIESNADSNNTTLSDAITAEETARKAQDKVISDKLDAEVGKLNDKLTELNAKVIQDIADSTAKDTEIDANISALQNLLSNVESKVDNEVERATNKDNELVAKDTELEARIQANTDNLNSEIARSKQVEKELNDKINSINLDSTNTNLSSEIDRATAAEATIQSNLDAEVTRAKASEKVNSDAITAEVERAKQAEKELSDKINSLDLDGANSAISSVNDKIDSEISRAKASEKVNSDSIAALQTSVAGLSESVNSQSAKDTELEAKIDINTNAISNEVERATNAEKALSDKVDAIDLTPLNNSISALDTKVDNVQSTLQSAIDNEVIRSKAAEKANADNITKLSTDIKEVDDKVKGIDLTPLSNSVSELDTKVDNSVSTLQTAIDNEVARAKASEKVNSDSITALQTSVSSLNDSMVSTNATISQLSADSSAKDSEIENSINVEKNRAENAEKALSDKIDVINADKETVGSIAHAIEDSNHYTDDELAKLRLESDAKYQPKGDYLTEHQSLSDYYNKETLNSMIGDKADKVNTYTKSEVDDAIANVDVTEQLKDYATKAELDDAIANVDVNVQLDDYVKVSENSLIKDQDGNIIPSLIIDFSDEGEDGTPVYNKNEVDEKFATKAELQQAIDNINVGGGNGEQVDMSGYATTTQLDSLGNQVVTISSDIALIQSDLSSKANSNDVYTKTDTYSKAQIDNMLANLIHVFTEDEFEALTDEEKNNGIVIVI